jgi:excisionase family DNA binding protein
MVPHTLYSLDDVAHRLGLNVRTVRGYVRSGRLKAVKIGKQYRVTRDSLEAVTGHGEAVRDAQTPRRRQVEVSSVIEISALDPESAGRVTNLLIGAAGGNRAADAPLRVETIHDPVRATMKIVVIGTLSAAADVFRLVGAVLEQ